MTPMLTLIITAENACTVCFGSGATFLRRGESVLLPCASSTELFFTVWGVSDPDREDSISIPALYRVTMTDGRISGSTARAIDWGDAAEIGVSPAYMPAPLPDRPKLMAEIDFVYRGRRARAELVSDGGAKLLILPEGLEPLSLPLGTAERGELRILDVGSARLLTVILGSSGKERIIAVSSEGETLLDEAGDTAQIDDGAPAVTNLLGTVRGHEKRTRYEFVRGTFIKTSETVGFFGKPRSVPSSYPETALALVQELRLGVFEKSDYRFAGALKDGVDETSLRDFLGEYLAEALYPYPQPEGKAVVGLISDTGLIRRPRRFLFAFEDGALVDIDEL